MDAALAAAPRDTHRRWSECSTCLRAGVLNVRGQSRDWLRENINSSGGSMKYLVLMVVFMVSACAKQVGPAGEVGPQGVAGTIGAQGVPGTPGTVIHAVTLCPTLGGAYPESYLTIGDDLYAVYSDNNGAHLAQLTPGTYRTTDGRNCIFSVNANNTISY